MVAEAEKIMTLLVDVDEPKTVGHVAEGELRIIPIIGGTVEGERLRGKVCPGGADWNTIINEDLCHVMARYWIQTEDGAVIGIENEGWLNIRAQTAVMRTTPRFLCDLQGKYTFLTHGCFTGELSVTGKNQVQIVVWKLR